MRWNALLVLASVLTLVLSGCSLFQSKKDADMQSSAEAPDFYASVPVEQPATERDPYVGDLVPGDAAEPVTNAYLAGFTGSRYHVVAKRDTLYGLARVYYGDQRRWKDIYEANRAEISNPNLIKVGQNLLIPE